MSVAWSSVFILLIHLFRKKQFFLNGFGLTTFVLLYICSIGRLFVAVEFPFTREIPVPEIYNRFYEAIRTEQIGAGAYALNGIEAFLLLWVTVSIVLIAVYFFRIQRQNNAVRTFRLIPNARAEAILAELQQSYGGKQKIQVSECSDISMPMGIGLFKKQILLPAASYTDTELRYILLHEYMHFHKNDLLILYLTELFCRLFWWNPLVYLLKADIRQILEIRCDLSVVTGMRKAERLEYLGTIGSCISQSTKLKTGYAPLVSANLFRKNNKSEEMLERFKLIAYPVKKNYFRFQVLCLVCAVLLLFFSYSFVLQPQYQPLKDEVFTDENVGESGTLSGYILAKQDGTYMFVDESGLEFELKKENVDLFASSGFEIREE